jgi:hypothetical protein
MSVRARGAALAFSVALALGVGLLAAGSGTARTPKDDDPTYDVLFEARLAPTERTAHVRIELGEGASNLHELRFSIDPERHVDFGGDGEVTLAADSVTWVPPTNGGELNYVFRIDHLRDQRSYDARCAATWALFRGDDLVPPVRSRFEDGAKSRSRLRFRLPKGWSAAVPYARLRGGDYRVRHRHRSFDRPTGWMVFGDIGVIREEVAGTRVAVAGPVRHGLRRLDLLALLSGPQSVYVHVDRPLITEDGTSPLLHEILHAAVGARADDEYDWIVEGLAEYYSIELLARSGTLSVERSEAALKKVGGVGDEKPTGVQHGRDTVRGVRFFHDLDQKIRAGSPDGSRSLDDVFRVLAAYRKKLTLEVVRQAVLEATGRSLADFGMDPAAEGQGG